MPLKTEELNNYRTSLTYVLHMYKQRAEKRCDNLYISPILMTEIMECGKVLLDHEIIKSPFLRHTEQSEVWKKKAADCLQRSWTGKAQC